MHNFTFYRFYGVRTASLDFLMEKCQVGVRKAKKNHPFQQKESEKKLLYAENENLCNSHVLQKATYGPRSWVKNSSTLIQLNFSAISSHKESVGRKKQVRWLWRLEYFSSRSSLIWQMKTRLPRVESGELRVVRGFTLHCTFCWLFTLKSQHHRYQEISEHRLWKFYAWSFFLFNSSLVPH